MPYKSTAQADFSIATKGKKRIALLVYILITAKYSAEYLAYYVYVHECIYRQGV